ncbi:MAG TPA: TIGR01777 family oxidoreductase [Burkholderiales bacterium]|nr:TIGR01777 family oxidoreductase [Burkholderiales bacterium]
MLLLDLLLVQVALGAFDTIYHHELKEQLPYRAGAAPELRIHGVRALLYALIVAGLAAFEWHGWLAVAFGALFVTEIVLTLRDFVIEDRTRKLPPSERITHALLAVNGGAFLLALADTLAGWWSYPGALTAADHGWRGAALGAACAGLIASGLRDLHAARKLERLPRASAAVDFGGRRLRVLVSGGTGFIGRRLIWTLLEQGHEVTVFARDATRAWLLFDRRVAVTERLDHLPSEARFDAAVNLAGAPVIGRPWTRARKAELLASRLDATREMLAFLARTGTTPVLISGSAIGYYGDRGETSVSEHDAGREVFMSQLCAAWEGAAQEAERLGVRVCTLRLGLVLGWGGALPMLIAPHLAALGARIGSGRQWVSWVHVDDVVAAIAFLIRNPHARGPFNVVAPVSLRQAELARAIARSYRRPLWITLPGRLLEALLGEMAWVFTRGQCVLPARLSEAGFRFRYADFDSALRAVRGNAP